MVYITGSKFGCVNSNLISVVAPTKLNGLLKLFAQARPLYLRVPLEKLGFSIIDVIPVIKDWKPSTRRDNSTGETIPYQRYSEWVEDKGI